MENMSALSGLRSLLPEITLLATAALAMIVHLFVSKRGVRLARLVSVAGFIAALAVFIFTPRNQAAVYAGSLAFDSFAFYFKSIVLIAGVLTLVLSFRFFDVEKSEPGEIYYLLPLTVIGTMAAVSSVDLVSTYVSFELFAIPSYILAGIFKKELRSVEAGVKYFFLGTLSSGIMLLGMALVFGLTGETSYAGAAKMIPGASGRVALIGMLLFFTGLFFKAALVPFHMWAPDVYEGAPTPLVVFLSTAPKVAVFGILIRLMLTVFGGFEAQWGRLFGTIAIATMFWGNIAALGQKNIKRLMAYSSIAQAGYLAIGLAAWGESAQVAVLYYLPAYLFMNAAAFGLILLFRKGRGFGEEIDDARGLARRSPFLAGCVLVVLLSLTGIPPTAGFMGKYFLFTAAMEKGLYVLAAAGALNSVISLFYYFRIGRAMFMEDTPSEVRVEPSLPVTLVLAVSAGALLVLGLFPSLLAEIAAAASVLK